MPASSITSTSLSLRTSRPFRPLVLHAGNGAGGDSGAAFEVLGGDAGEGQPAHLIAGFFPGVPRNAQHGGLAGPGIADHDSEVVAFRDMGKGGTLLPRQHKTALPSQFQRPPCMILSDAMPLALRHDLGRPVQPLLHRDHLPAGEAVLVPSVPA